MKLLVTGGAGFIGSNFIRYWLKKYPHDKVINLDALTYAGNLENLKDVENNPNYSFVKGSIGDAEVLSQAMKGVDYVVNFAAESHNDNAVKDPGIFLRTNVVGTQILLEAAKNENVKRFHHVSTCEVFGDLELDEDRAFKEGDPFAPRTPYNASKAGTNHVVMAYAHTYGLPVSISHCSNNYGPYQFPEKLIPLFTANALENKSLPLFKSSQNRREWIHVDDHNSGIEFILLKGKAGEAYNLGTGVEKSIEEITDLILENLGKPESLKTYVADRLGHDKRYLMDTTKIRKLGWEPLISFEEGIRETINWYKENTGWLERIKTGEYRNYSKVETMNNFNTEKKKILIIGAGAIGSVCAESWDDAVLADKRINSKEDVLALLDKYQPEAVLNAAGVRGKPNVDWCDDNQLTTILGNTKLPIMIAEACQERGVYMLHIGSGCIYYGESPDSAGWNEEDFGNPKPTYSRAKYAADLVLSTLPNVGIARIRMPLGSKPAYWNLIDKLASFEKVIDVENSVTIVDDMVEVFYQLMAKKAEGIFHVTNPGTIRHKEIIAWYEELVDPSHKNEWISNDQLVEQGLAKKGRSNNFLQSKNLEKYGIRMRPAKEALRDSLVKYGNIKKVGGFCS